MRSKDEITTSVDQLLPVEAERHRSRFVEANDALAINELRNMLTRQQEQEIVVKELRGIVDTLAEGLVVTIEEVQALRRNVATLERHQKELHDKQDKIAELCEHLVASVAGATEP